MLSGSCTHREGNAKFRLMKAAMWWKPHSFSTFITKSHTCPIGEELAIWHWNITFIILTKTVEILQILLLSDFCSSIHGFQVKSMYLISDILKKRHQSLHRHLLECCLLNRFCCIFMGYWYHKGSSSKCIKTHANPHNYFHTSSLQTKESGDSGGTKSRPVYDMKAISLTNYATSFTVFIPKIHGFNKFNIYPLFWAFHYYKRCLFFTMKKLLPATARTVIL